MRKQPERKEAQEMDGVEEAIMQQEKRTKLQDREDGTGEKEERGLGVRCPSLC